LEVLAEFTEDELAAFAQEVVANETWIGLGPDGEDIWDQCPEEEIERFVWYRIPAEVINARGRARPVPADEMTFLSNPPE
jgi:hypothetical protein